MMVFVSSSEKGTRPVVALLASDGTVVVGISGAEECGEFGGGEDSITRRVEGRDLVPLGIINGGGSGDGKRELTGLVMVDALGKSSPILRYPSSSSSSGRSNCSSSVSSSSAMKSSSSPKGS